MLQKWLETWQIVRNKSSIEVLFHSLQRIKKKEERKEMKLKEKMRIECVRAHLFIS